jgi:hypothetical protein
LAIVFGAWQGKQINRAFNFAIVYLNAYCIDNTILVGTCLLFNGNVAAGIPQLQDIVQRRPPAIPIGSRSAGFFAVSKQNALFKLFDSHGAVDSGTAYGFILGWVDMVRGVGALLSSVTPEEILAALLPNYCRRSHSSLVITSSPLSFTFRLMKPSDRRGASCAAWSEALFVITDSTPSASKQC